MRLGRETIVHFKALGEENELDQAIAWAAGYHCLQNRRI